MEYMNIRLQSLAMMILVTILSFPAYPLSLSPPSNTPEPPHQPQPYSKLRAPFLRQFRFDQRGWCVSPSTFYWVPPAGSIIPKTLEFSMRNVPGEGDCVFLAVAMATAASMGLASRTRTNVDDTGVLRTVAEETRQVVAKILSSDGNLHIEGNRICRARDLLRSAANGEGLKPEAYLDRLLKHGRCGGLHGGGPELTALSNVLRRPISVYELHGGDDCIIDDSSAIADANERGSQSHDRDSGRCKIDRVGLFGDAFVDRCGSIPDSAVLKGHGAFFPGSFSWGLHILILDVAGGALEKHACALLPRF